MLLQRCVKSYITYCIELHVTKVVHQFRTSCCMHYVDYYAALPLEDALHIALRLSVCLSVCRVYAHNSRTLWQCYT